MAIYHLRVSNVSRGEGRSAIASAAYISGSRLIDDRGANTAIATAAYISGERLRAIGGHTVDYTDKTEVMHAEISLPDGAPHWFADRQKLWQHVEAVEKRWDARLAKSLIVALPAELSVEQNVALARGFVTDHLVAQGLAVDWAIHNPPDANGEPQPHLHAQTTTREITPLGFEKKLTALNSKAFVLEARREWAAHANRALERHGHDSRITEKSFADLGIGLEPTIKLGPAASRMEGKGERSDRLAHNRGVRIRNGLRLERDPTIALQALRHNHAGTPSRAAVEKFVARYAGKARAAGVADKVMHFLEQQLERLQATLRKIVRTIRPAPAAPTKTDVAMAATALQARLNRELDEARQSFGPDTAEAAVRRIKLDMARLPLVVARVRQELARQPAAEREAQELAAGRRVAEDVRHQERTRDAMRKVAARMRGRDDGRGL